MRTVTWDLVKYVNTFSIKIAIEKLKADFPPTGFHSILVGISLGLVFTFVDPISNKNMAW